MIEQVDKKRLIADIQALFELNRPYIERSLFHKVQELKFIISSDINQSDKGKTLNRQTSPKKNSLSKVIDFELYKIVSIWIPIIPDMVDINPYMVLPLPLIDYIVESAEAGIAALKKPVQVKNQPPVKVSFQQESHHLIKGTIEKIENKSNPRNNQVELIESKSNKDDLQTLLEYLLSNEAFSDYMTREFFLKWKPLIDAGCLDFSQLSAM
ncbi:MAG: hypothetical protein MUF15_11560 [Acidobacteria bacterium]|jgi:hypothetical protein|nr:hypothetical protein [Acidobacteriota bacterium]